MLVTVVGRNQELYTGVNYLETKPICFLKFLGSRLTGIRRDLVSGIEVDAGTRMNGALAGRRSAPPILQELW